MMSVAGVGVGGEYKLHPPLCIVSWALHVKYHLHGNSYNNIDLRMYMYWV